MPSTYTTNGGIEKIASGEQSGTWGDTTNTNFDIIDRITNGVGTIDLSASGAAHTLTTTDGTLSDGMYKVLVLSGATEACTITVAPNTAQKIYFINNTSSFNCVISQGSGTSVTVESGNTGFIYCDGGGATAAVVDFSQTIGGFLPLTGGTLTGDLTVDTVVNTTTANITTVDFGDWTITESGGSLYFATGGVNKMKLDSSGNLDIVGSVNTNATIS